METIIGITEEADLLSALTSLVQLVIWTGIVVFFCWSYWHRRQSSKKAKIYKLEKDVAHWEKEFSKQEALAKRRKRKLKAARKSLPREALKKYDAEIKQGNEERAARELGDWFEREASWIAEVSFHLAEWHLAFYPENQAKALADAECFITIGRALNPADDGLRKLEFEFSERYAPIKEEQGEWSRADKLWERTWDLTYKYVGEDSDPATLNKLGLEALGYHNYSLARIFFNRATDILRLTAGPDDRNTLNTQSNVAVALNGLGRHEEAEALFRQTCEAKQAELGPDDPDTLRSQHGLAVTLDNLNRFDEAEALFRQTLEAMKAKLGPNDRDTFNSQHSLAVTLDNLNRFDEAEALHRQTWEARKAKLGPDDPDTLHSQHELAVTLHALDRFDEAEALHRQTWEARKAKLDPDDRDTLRSQHELAVTLHALDRFDEAEALHRQTWEAAPFINAATVVSKARPCTGSVPAAMTRIPSAASMNWP